MGRSNHQGSQRARASSHVAVVVVVLVVMGVVASLAASCGPSRLAPIYATDASLGVAVDAPADMQRTDATTDATETIDVAAPDLPSDMQPDLPVAPAVCPTALVGFASHAPGTTGGQGGVELTVATYDDLQRYAEDTRSLVIKIATRIVAPVDAPQIRLASNKTVRGTALGAELAGAGFNLVGVSNVIIQNLIISKGIPDAISINKSKNVWIDHCDLSSDPLVQNVYDGLIDISHAADWITISWNVLHDHQMASLVGHSDSAAAMLEDPGHLTVTYHHNWFRGTLFYNPRIRFGKVHVFNNFYDYQPGLDVIGVTSQMNAVVFVEANDFRNVRVPMTTTRGDSAEDGLINSAGNVLNGSGDSTITRMTSWFPAAATDEYSYRADDARVVAVTVGKCAGPMN